MLILNRRLKAAAGTFTPLRRVRRLCLHKVKVCETCPLSAVNNHLLYDPPPHPSQHHQDGGYTLPMLARLLISLRRLANQL